MNTRNVYVFAISLLLLNTHISGSWSTLFDYIWPKRNARLFDGDLQSLPKVPFEIGERDEKFIVEASKALGTTLSDLDFCQQKITLSLRSACTSLTEEQVGRLAILLMNCQLESEGQKGYECTEAMSLAECMSSLTEDARVLYHNLQNRAKTMCLIIRQQQFRGLAEITVNNLMKSAHDNIEILSDLKRSQEELQKSALIAMEGLTGSNTELLEQQQDVLKLIETQRVNAARNLQATLRERNILKAGHLDMNILITELNSQIQKSLSHLQDQSEEARQVYNGLLRDIFELQEATEQIAVRLDEASNLILEQSKLTKDELKGTVAQLREVNDIVSTLSAVVDNFHNNYKEKTEWLRQQVGGSEELVVKHLTAAAFHIGYLLVGMLCLIFVNANTLSRILFLLVVFLNSIAVLYGFIQLDIATLTQTTAIILGSKYFYNFLQKYDLRKYFEMGQKKGEVDGKTNILRSGRSNLTDIHTIRNETTTSRTVFQFDTNNNGDLNHQDGSVSARIRKQYFNEKRAVTPSSYIQLTSGGNQHLDRSRSSTPFSQQSSVTASGGTRCIAYTARGTKCQLTSANGSYCRIHERSNGD